MSERARIIATCFALVALTFAGTTAAAATLLHHYSFTGDVSDGNGGENGTLLNGAAVSDGALTLDGIDDFVQFDTHLVPTSGSYSVALFARQASAQDIHVELLSQGQSGSQGFYIGHNPQRFIRATDSWVDTGVPMPKPGEWHHYALVVDELSGTSIVYVDGSASAVLSFAITSTPLGDPTRFGAQFQGIGEFFHGQLDEIHIFSGALTDAEVADLAAAAPAVVPLPAAGWLFGGCLLLLATRKGVKATRDQIESL